MVGDGMGETGPGAAEAGGLPAPGGKAAVLATALVVPGAATSDTVSRLTGLGVSCELAEDLGCAGVLDWFADRLTGRTLLVDGGLQVASAALGQLVDDPAVTTGALVADGPGDREDTPVRVRQRRITGAGSRGWTASGAVGAEQADVIAGTLGVIAGTWGEGGWRVPICWGLPPGEPAAASDAAPPADLGLLHEIDQPTGVSLGALVIGAPHVAAAQEALRGAAAAARQLGWVADPVDLAMVALVRAQVPLAAAAAVGPWFRRGEAQARARVVDELADLDEARVLLERANRPDDGFYSTFVLRKASKPVTALALRLGFSPNQVSLFSLFVGLSAAVLFGVGSPWTTLIGALLLQASLIIDCVDGEVARFTRTFSTFGAWLDAATDRVKEYAAYAGLAWGASRHGSDLWLLAALVMVMQSVRHIGDYDFSRVQRIRESWVPRADITVLTDAAGKGTGATLEISAALNQRSNVRWAKKVLHMPIGERWLVISVGAVALGARGTFWVLLALGLIALAYTSLGRILRSRTWHHPPEQSGEWLLTPQLDLGPVGQWVWDKSLGRRRPLAAAFGWALPVSLRVVEFGVVLGAAIYLNGRLTGPPQVGSADSVLGLSTGATTWVFAWLFVVSFHHYDTLYRALGGQEPPRWLVWSGLGWEGRTLVAALLASAGAAAFGRGMAVGAHYFGALFVIVASAQWVRVMRARG